MDIDKKYRIVCTIHDLNQMLRLSYDRLAGLGDRVVSGHLTPEQAIAFQNRTTAYIQCVQLELSLLMDALFSGEYPRSKIHSL